jgi:O-antigen ligase
MLWPRALNMFFESPYVGVGFGAYNDIPFKPEGLSGFFSWSRPLIYVNSNSHAHNSYFHIAAEMVILGLFMVYKFIGAIFTASERLGSKIDHDIVFYIVWVLLIMSLSEHRLFSPSNALPVFIIVSWIPAQPPMRQFGALK